MHIHPIFLCENIERRCILRKTDDHKNANYTIFIDTFLGELPITNKILYSKQTTQDAVEHQS